MMCYEVLRIANIVLLLFITCSLLAQCADHRTARMLKVFYLAVALVLIISAYSTIDLKLRGVPAAPRNLVQFVGFILLLLATYREFLIRAFSGWWDRYSQRREAQRG